MARPKSLTDAEALEAAHRLIHALGPEGLSFGRLAAECGLSPSTLVQRFGTKAGLVRATLIHAWDRLDATTDRLAAEAPQGAEAAVALLVRLSEGYGDIERYAEGLRVLREDVRDPALRARGAAWRARLAARLDACLAAEPGAPPGAGAMLATQWQGALLWWSFDPAEPVARHVEAELRRFLAALLRS